MSLPALTPALDRRASGRRLPTSRRLDPALAAEHLDRVYRYALALSRDAQVAEDLVQDAYLATLRKPRMLRDTDELGYLLRSVRNGWNDTLRRRQRRPAFASLDAENGPVPMSSRPAADPEAALSHRELLGALHELPGDFRDAVIAIDVVGLEYHEAARLLGVAQGTVASRVARGRARLARELLADREPARR